MKTTEQKKIRQSIIKLLTDKKIYTEEIDDFLINQFITNLSLIEKSEKDILKRGMLINLRQPGQEPYMQINFSISILHNAIKSNNTILKQLGLEKIQLDVDKKEDAFKAFQNLLN